MSLANHNPESEVPRGHEEGGDGDRGATNEEGFLNRLDRSS